MLWNQPDSQRAMSSRLAVCVCSASRQYHAVISGQLLPLTSDRQGRVDSVHWEELQHVTMDRRTIAHTGSYVSHITHVLTCSSLSCSCGFPLQAGSGISIDSTGQSYSLIPQVLEEGSERFFLNSDPCKKNWKHLSGWCVDNTTSNKTLLYRMHIRKA